MIQIRILDDLTRVGLNMLERLSDRIWYYPMEEERDRPNLGYIRGDNWSIAVDAGHSEAHTREFYKALEENGMPFPKLTIITHWHWDHTFGMHAVNGLCLANERTNKYLIDFKRRISQEGPGFFLNMHETIRNEYSDNKPVIVSAADMIFHDSIMLDAGNCTVKIFQAEAPHTDDSTFIEVPEEGVLFVGDATCGSLPEWKKDSVLSLKLAETIQKSEATICIEGHWIPVPKDDTIRDLLAEVDGK